MFADAFEAVAALLDPWAMGAVHRHGIVPIRSQEVARTSARVIVRAALSGILEDPIMGEEAEASARRIGVRKHLNMTPREFVQSLGDPEISRRLLGPKATDNDARRAELAGWLWAEATWPTWGDGGKAFIGRALRAVDEGNLEAWLAGLPPMPKKEVTA